MIFGTQIGVAPGTLAMRLNGTMPQGPGTCPPDPVWRYFPSPFEPLNYTGIPSPPTPPPVPTAPINIEPPPRPGYDDPDPPERPTGPAMTPLTPQPGRTPSPPTMTPGPLPPQMPGMVLSPRTGVYVPYGTESRLAGLSAPGPFGMTWGGLLGVLGIAVAGGAGLGYLWHRRG